MTARGLIRKEWLESVRTYRLLIMPLVFLLLGIAQPVVFHFMPTIMEQAGLPEGIVFELPPMEPADVLSSVLDQYNQVGVLTVILVSMGLFGKEIESGVAGFMRTLGISRLHYFGTKWVMLAAITLTSVLLGMVGAAYYTRILFAPLPWSTVLLSALVYFLYLSFVLTLSLSLNTIIVNPLGAAAITLGANVILSIAGTLSVATGRLLPGYAGHVGKALLYGPADGPGLWWLITAAWTGLTFALGYVALKRRDL